MTAPKRPEASVVTLLVMLAGPLIWGLHFGIVYAAHHLICTLTGHNAAFWAQLAVIAITVPALLALLLILIRPGMVQRLAGYGKTPKNTRYFMTGVMRLLALLSCLGVLWAGSAALFLPACESIV